MKLRFTFSFLLFIACAVHGQTHSKYYAPYREVASDKIHEANLKNFYPLEDGSFWEYIQKDSAYYSIGSIKKFNLSKIREVIGDTLMANGLIYKIIKWKYAAINAISQTSVFEYHRKDSLGKVYMYYEGKDYLLYDFTKSIGDAYDSYLPGWKWKITNKETVAVYDMTFQNIEFVLDSMGIVKDEKRITENFGLTYYKTNGYEPGNLWGGIINGIEYGYLLAQKQKIDWSLFYPLHIGDLRVSKTNQTIYHCGQFNGGIFIFKVIKDTLMPDKNQYFVSSNNYISRIDSNGQIIYYSDGKAIINPYNKLDVRAGNSIQFDRQVLSKSYENGKYKLEFGSKYDETSTSYVLEEYIEGLGCTYYVSMSSFGYNTSMLIGARINGVVWGDISAINVEDEPENIVANYKLEQNYPNPFNPTTKISFDLPKESFVSLTIYNILGEKIETLVNEIRRAGSHTVTFDAHNLPSGVYIYKITAGSYQASRKMLLMK